MAGEAGNSGSSVGRVDTTAAGPTASQRPSSPPTALCDMFSPVAENWCYTQVYHSHTVSLDNGAVIE